jgi:NAD(P)-dependent dehydrogenase (short-subunit alcohol dehydrogenase family)
MADQVVKEIVDAGGRAVADYGSVSNKEHAAKMVKAAVDNFGKLDICINNAGILRDKSFKNMTDENWEIVLDVHLRGTYFVTKAAYDRMIEQGTGGRIIMTSSTSGLLGNFGQTNYGAAKAGIAGFMRCLAPEGAKYGITVNLLAPAAWSRLTEDIMPAAVAEPLAPEKVSPAVVWLCTDEAAGVTGRTFVVGGNKVTLLAWQGVPVAARPNDQAPWDVAEIGKKILESVDKWPRGLTFQDLT